MTIDETKTKPKPVAKTISLVTAKDKEEEVKKAYEKEVQELLDQGMEAFKEELDAGSPGFLSLVFDKNGDPKIIWSGDFDMVKAVGALELAKCELTRKLFDTSE